MSEPEKPFACTIPDCGMTFTNEDHLNVHTKKHDMVLQLALGQKGVGFVADQTPTPTRFIRNCEEVGLFQDLQNVNPFDETFKRAMETRSCPNSLETMVVTHGDDVLHTPHIFPHLSEDSPTGGYTSNGQTNTTETAATTVESNVESNKNKDSETPIDSKSAKAICTVSTAQKHNLAVQKGQLTHCVDASLRLPVISISDPDDNSERLNTMRTRCSCSSKLLKNDIILTYPTRSNVESLHPISLEGNSVQLISQKSIEQALDNLTREQQPVIVEKRAISGVQKSDATKIKITENKPVKRVRIISMEGDLRLKRQNADPFDTGNKVCPEKRLEKPDSTSELRLENLDDKSEQDGGDGLSNGYEILLKLPNGEKVFLKQDKSAPHPQDGIKGKEKTTKSLIKDAIIRSKLKKAKIHQYSFSKNAKLPLPANPNKLIVPQNINYVQGILATETIAKAKVLGIADSNKDTIVGRVKVIKTIGPKTNTKPNESQDNVKEKKNLAENDKEKVRERQLPAKDPKIIESNEIMAAAGRRYRHRKKENFRMLVEENRKLQMENEAMSNQLLSSMMEIKRLRDLLHTQQSNATIKQLARGFIIQNVQNICSPADLEANEAVIVKGNAKAPSDALDHSCM